MGRNGTAEQEAVPTCQTPDEPRTRADDPGRPDHITLHHILYITCTATRAAMMKWPAEGWI